MKDEYAKITIGHTKPDDMSDILDLLRECELPSEGLAAHQATTLLARSNDEIVGCAALELHQEYALLRSVAVKQSHRNQSAGQLLVSASLKLASRHSIIMVYLLTETAEAFFEKFGFKPVPRSDVPGKVQRSVEFTSLCPETATVMAISLG